MSSYTLDKKTASSTNGAWKNTDPSVEDINCTHSSHFSQKSIKMDQTVLESIRTKYRQRTSRQPICKNIQQHKK